MGLDYLVSGEETTEPVDNRMPNRVREIQKLADKEKETILSIMDAYIRDCKAKQAYAS